MDCLVWAEHTSEVEEVQQKIKDNVSSLILTYFSTAEDYTKEKFIKTYCESLRSLERLLIKQRGLENLSQGYAQKGNVGQLFEQYQEVKRIMLSAASRQFRHYITFLPEIKTMGVLKEEK